MTKSTHLLKLEYFTQISQAKENGYEAVLIPFNDDCDLICLNNIDDKDYIMDITYEFGWSKFLIMNLSTNKSKMIISSELGAA